VPIAARLVGPAADNKARTTAADVLRLETLFSTFAQLLLEVENARLLLITPSELLLEISKTAREMGIREKVTLVPEDDRELAIEVAEIVIADHVVMRSGDSFEGAESLAILGMAHGKAVLAADNAVNRERSLEGRGLLWYSPAPEPSPREMVHRLSFMTRNADFRRALGEAGKQHLQQTRSPQRLGKLYDEVYRHAMAKAHRGKPFQNASGSLIPMQAGI
jgi:glycosyltransferase involved in cell wall biosynthesis